MAENKSCAPILSDQIELLYKVLVVGDVSTGKTSFIKRYVHNIFSASYKSTIGVDFALKAIMWNDHTNIRLQLWDIAGQERFSNMTRVYYKDAVAAFVVFDVLRPSTFESVKKWKQDIDNKIKLPNTDDNIPVILLANKIDLLDPVEDKENIDNMKETLDKICKDCGFLTWFEISAKKNIGINEAANALIEEILDKIKDEYIDDEDSDNIMLNADGCSIGTSCC